MPRVSEELGKATRFPEKTREKVISQWLAGIADQTIAKGFRYLEVQDVKDIVQLYKNQFPDEFEDLRKKRQIEFIDKAWEIISLSQKKTIAWLKLKQSKSFPSLYMSIMAITVDKLKMMEGREAHGEDKSADFKLNKNEEEEFKKAKQRVTEASKIEASKKDILVEANKIIETNGKANYG